MPWPQLIVGALVCTAFGSWMTLQMGVIPIDPAAHLSQLRILLLHGLPVVLLWLAAYGFGAEMARALNPDRTAPADPLTASVAGMGLLLWGHWLNSFFLGLASWIAWLLVLPLVAVGIWRLWQARTQFTASRPHPSVMILGLPLGMLLATACCPPGTLWRVEAYGYDVTSYHLELPREWIAGSTIEGFEHNVYSFFPSLMEIGYTLIPKTLGTDDLATLIYSSQLLHASLALATALCLARLAGRVSPVIGWITAGVFLALPWVQVTGSLAYNEMGVLAFSALALDRALRADPDALKEGLLIGGLLGLATMCKLTAGPMLGIPIVAITLTKWLLAKRSREDLQTLTICIVIGGLVMLAPYFARNAYQTDNPVFPFAASVFGSGHWTEAEIERWDRAHMSSADQESIITSLDRQLLRNTGYGAIGGWSVPIETRNIARFDAEGGFPLLWPVVLAGIVIGLLRRDTRLTTALLVTTLVWQLLFWGITTHHQSRFLIPLLLPALMLVGIALEPLARLRSASNLTPVAGTLWVSVIWFVSLNTLWQQTIPVQPDPSQPPFPAPAAWLIGALERGEMSQHPLNNLPEQSNTYLVADASRLLYLERPFVYESAFDHARMGDWIRLAEEKNLPLEQILHNLEITHIWAHWSELQRLHSTYGYDPDVTIDKLRTHTQGWEVVEDVGAATLYRVPDLPPTTEDNK